MNDKKQIRAWALYDWANSAYSLIITSAIFPVYYLSIVEEEVRFLGNTWKNETLAFLTITLSYLIISFLSPLLSGIADNRGSKKKFLRFYYTLGSVSCIALFFFTKDLGEYYVFYGLFFSMLASIGYCGSIVFYNAFLPEIASKETQDQVSAKGFVWGYVGSVLLMVVCLAGNLLNDEFGWIAKDLPARFSFIAVGVWWFYFAQRSLKTLKEKKVDVQDSNIWSGYLELKKVWQKLKKLPVLKSYLFSFFFFNMGVQTIMYLATYFAKDELQMETTELILTVLIIQIVAIGGAWTFAKMAKRFGNYTTLLIIIVIWIGICVAAYLVQTVNGFYMLAFAVGLVMGGVQSLSRSTYSILLPKTKDTASFFSFYDVCYNIGIVIGTGAFAIIGERADMRISILALSVFFVIGGVLLFLLKKKYNETTYN